MGLEEASSAQASGRSSRVKGRVSRLSLVVEADPPCPRSHLLLSPHPCRSLPSSPTVPAFPFPLPSHSAHPSGQLRPTQTQYPKQLYSPDSDLTLVTSLLAHPPLLEYSMLATFALSLLALASTPAFASNAAHQLDGRGCGHKKAADRFIKRSLPFGAREYPVYRLRKLRPLADPFARRLCRPDRAGSEIPVIAINSNTVGANSSINADLTEVFNSTALWFEATGGAGACGLVYK